MLLYCLYVFTLKLDERRGNALGTSRRDQLPMNPGNGYLFFQHSTLSLFTFLNWRIIALQCCAGFCHTTTQISQPKYMYIGFPGGSAVKNAPAVQEMQEACLQPLSWEGPLEEELASCSSILAWKISRAMSHGVTKSQTPLK